MKKSIINTLQLVAIFSAVLFSNFSCEDHPMPEVLPVLKTLPITQTGWIPGAETLLTNNYRMLIEEEGSVPVKSYGISFTTYYESEYQNPSNVINKLPTADGAPHTFTDSFGKGEKTFLQAGNYPLRTDVYQRAYVILVDGRVIYGDVILTVAGKITPIL